MSIPQASVSNPAARQGIQKRLTFCHVNPPGDRQLTDSVARDSEGGTHLLSDQSPGERQQAGSAAGNSEGGAHMLSCQSPRPSLASPQRGKNSEGRTHVLSCQSPRRSSACRQRGKGFRRGNSQAVMSIPQAIVSSMAARQGIQKGELAGCHVNPPGERQQAGSSGKDSEGGTH